MFLMGMCLWWFLCCSCWYFLVEEQEDLSGSAGQCYRYMGSVWIAWIPPVNSRLPHLDSVSCGSVLVVQCLHIYQQVRLLSLRSFNNSNFCIFFSRFSFLPFVHLGVVHTFQNSISQRSLFFRLPLHWGLRSTMLLVFCGI